MNTITFTQANKQFAGKINVGQYVAWWISDDSQDSLPMVADSHDTAEAALADAESEGAEQGIEGGSYVAELVIADAD